MLIQTEIEVDPKDYEFVKKVYKDLRYKSLKANICEKPSMRRLTKTAKRRWNKKRIAAMEMVGKASYDSHFYSIEGEDFESR